MKAKMGSPAKRSRKPEGAIASGVDLSRVGMKRGEVLNSTPVEGSQPRASEGVESSLIGYCGCRDGSLAFVDTEGTDGNWYGRIPGHFTSTWWHHDGRHNLFPDFDIIGRAQAGPPA